MREGGQRLGDMSPMKQSFFLWIRIWVNFLKENKFALVKILKPVFTKIELLKLQDFLDNNSV